MRQLKVGIVLALILLAASGCGTASQPLTGSERLLLALDLAHTRRAGRGPSFRPPAASFAVAHARPVGPWRCLAHRATAYGAHIELFAHEQGMVVPGGIGISRAGRCLYPLRTTDPTGVIQVQAVPARAAPRLGELFALWGQPFGRDRLGAFSGRVVAFLNGRRWQGDPRDIPLRRHAQVVVELGGFVAPHPSYGFPPGL